MTDHANATPRPWRLTGSEANPRGNVEFHILGPVVRRPRGTAANDFEPAHIAVVDGPLTPKRNAWEASGDESAGNALLIVEAVNAYDALREENARLREENGNLHRTLTPHATFAASEIPRGKLLAISMVALRAERDALLAALKEIAYGYRTPVTCRATARAAIARAEGGSK